MIKFRSLKRGKSSIKHDKSLLFLFEFMKISGRKTATQHQNNEFIFMMTFNKILKIFQNLFSFKNINTFNEEF